jgi:hypothetical protein
MKNLIFVLMLLVFVACGAPAPEVEEPATTDDATKELATAEEIEGEEEEESEALPEGAMPLLEILARLEALGYTEIVESEYEDGVWEIEYIVDGEERELHVDPVSGEIVPEEPEGAEDD